MSHSKLTRTLGIITDFLKDDKAAERSDLKGFFDYLQASENQALAFIDMVLHNKKPDVEALKHGSMEAGFVLYWIHHPHGKLGRVTNENIVFRQLLKGLTKLAPPTQITPEEYEPVHELMTSKGVAWNDGTLFGTEKYEQLDPLWAISSLNYVLNLIDPQSIVKFPDNAPYAKELKPKEENNRSDLVIGIIGDWGTGLYTDVNGTNSCVDSPSQRVINDVQAHPELDYLIHLGDVYYAGTEFRPPVLEEWENFSALWPNQGPERNFTLNSNHEMYGDASGYFHVALDRHGDFGHQNGMSYFSMTYGNWLLIGLDSGYYSDAENGLKMYMEGAIGTDEFTQQIDWLKGFKDYPGPIMIMTHHDPCDFSGDVAGNTLWKQVTDAIGMPAVWYYGHVHNGVVYKELRDSKNNASITTKARCCGHGAVPFGKAWETDSNMQYYAHTPDPVMGDPRVLNGYATVTLKKDGSYREDFFETGNGNPVFSQHWSADELLG